MASPRPAPQRVAWPAVARCVAVSVPLLVRGQVRLPRHNLGRTFRFADGTTATTYRETVVARGPRDPCFLAVSFRLRGVRGPRGHAAFRAESLLNTPLFVGFPGFVSKLWLAADERHVYRGLYEWDGSERAEHYARSLWRVLALVSEPTSIDYRIESGLGRDEAIRRSAETALPGSGGWWQVVEG
ncbi:MULTISPECIES: hypothetical protein [unclassified Isoptericola]|uniref:hypothetical protein n=1 Tax=unclassified Isoptericola TaxID=2623355 RepID=UPI002712683D|nr:MULTISPECIES: hypothetical protein [unclassified Isoptericola]MDO8149110.1 hypothetical protein [Isoptericola sp. b515]MDO8150944.1 hypothetical protein [Isoptericola sp. b408]